ncbi:MAG TPA: hypothetical protein EYQ81_16625 [Sneathiellales bacterium]|nr:hypothetical protein [Sneathiellales bacterium]
MSLANNPTHYKIGQTSRTVAQRLAEFYDAGVRHMVMDFVGPYEDRDQQFERFASEVKPLLSGLLKQRG